jgi:hypothetical protein
MYPRSDRPMRAAPLIRSRGQCGVACLGVGPCRAPAGIIVAVAEQIG